MLYLRANSVDETTKDLKYTECFLDDFCIFASTFNEMLDSLHQYLARLHNANLQLRIDKCKFLERFLGMVNNYRQFVPNMADISEPLND